MKNKSETASGLQELCRKLKLQLDELNITLEPDTDAREDEERRNQLMEQLKRQLAELST
jgi:hypothetical protein